MAQNCSTADLGAVALKWLLYKDGKKSECFSHTLSLVSAFPLHFTWLMQCRVFMFMLPRDFYMVEVLELVV